MSAGIIRHLSVFSYAGFSILVLLCFNALMHRNYTLEEFQLLLHTFYLIITFPKVLIECKNRGNQMESH